MTNPEVVVGDIFSFKGRTAFLGYADYISGKNSINKRVAAEMERYGYGDGDATITVTATGIDGITITAIEVRHPNDGNRVLCIDAKTLGYDRPSVAIFGRTERGNFLTKISDAMDINAKIHVGACYKFRDAIAFLEFSQGQTSSVNSKVCVTMVWNGFNHNSVIQIIDAEGGTARSIRVHGNGASMVIDKEVLGLKTIGRIAIFFQGEADKFLVPASLDRIPKPVPPVSKPEGGLYDVVVVPGKVACSFNKAFRALYAQPKSKLMTTVELCQTKLDAARDAKKAALAEIERQNEILNKADADIIQYTDALVGATYIMARGEK